MEKEDRKFWLGILLILALSAGMYFRTSEKSYVPTGSVISTSSNVTVMTVISAAASNNLDDGIQFQSVSQLPATDVNATDNYVGSPSQSSLYVAIGNSTNVNIDVCLNASAPLTLGPGLAAIPIENYTFVNNTSPDPGDASSSIPISTTAQKTHLNVPIDPVTGAQAYFRFWIDVPSNTPPGDYNNTLFFYIMQNGENC